MIYHGLFVVLLVQGTIGATIHDREKRQVTGANDLFCPSTTTKIKTPYIYLAQGSADYQTCGALIGTQVNVYTSAFRNECQRWMGGATPDHAHSGKVVECQEFPGNGTVYYRADLCCKGTVPAQRCFQCSGVLDPYVCNYHSNPTTCPTGQECRTQYTCSAGDVRAKITKGCAVKSSSTCPDASCAAAVLQTGQSCSVCCNTPFCNQDTHSHTCFASGAGGGGTCNCNGKGYCVNNACVCIPGCSGTNCETCVCDPNPCENGGKCKGVVSGSGYTCCCAQGFGGVNCTDRYTTQCSNNICQHGGTCIVQGTGSSPTCVCPSGWIGDTCEIEQNVACSNPDNFFESERIYSSLSCSAIGTIPISPTQELGSCLYLMRNKYNSALFKDGQVDAVESIGYSYCGESEICTQYVTGTCCPSCYSSPCQNGGYCKQHKTADGRFSTGDYTCQCRFGFAGTHCETKLELCLVFGEPHYLTFDGQHFTFQGICKYNLATPSSSASSLDYFQVFTKNEHRGGRTDVSYPDYVEIHFNGYVVRLVKNPLSFLVKTGSNPFTTVYPDAYYPRFNLTYNGRFLHFETDFRLIVEYDSNIIVVVVPDTYKGQMGGLCNDMDGVAGQDDMVDCNGVQQADTAAGHSAYGDSCGAPDDENPSAVCITVPPADCSAADEQKYSGANFCEPITSTTGPFASCAASTVVDSSLYFAACVYDLCRDESLRCTQMESYATACINKGVPPVANWRAITNCRLNCPANSQYKFQGVACPATCENPDAPERCSHPVTEICECNPGFILKDSACVLPSECGCKDNNVRYSIGDVWGQQELVSGSCIQKKCVACTRCALPVGKVLNNDTNVTPIHGGWGDWSDWSACTDTIRTQTRTHTCDNPVPRCGGNPCSGAAQETVACPTASTTTTSAPITIAPTLPPPPSCSPSFNIQDECAKCDKINNKDLYVANPCDCTTFYQCEPGLFGYRVYTRPCPPCLCYNDRTHVCSDLDPNRDLSSCSHIPGSETIGVGNGLCRRSANGYSQTYKNHPDITKYIWVLATGDQEMDCPPGTVFSLDTCVCGFGTNPAEMKPKMCLTFDHPSDQFGTIGGIWVDPNNVGIVSGGIYKNAGRFYGSSNIEIPYFSGQQMSKFSFSLFFKRENSGTGVQGLLSNEACGDDSLPSVQVRSEDQGTLGAGVRTKTRTTLNNLASTGASFDVWNHVVLTYDGAEVKYYHNGTLIDTKPGSGFVAYNYCPLLVGSMYGKNYFTGLMDQICYYDEALTQQHVNFLYNNPGETNPRTQTT